MPTASQYQELLASSPTLQQFLNLVSWAEGANYNTGYGGRLIPDLSNHPYNRGQFRITDPVSGKSSTTSAAGRYQFERATWDDIKNRLGLQDFSPQSQDIGAVDLIYRAGALPDVLSGNIAGAVSKLKPIWQGFITHPLSTITGKFNQITGNSKYPTPQNANNNMPDFPLNANVIGAQNRYLIAFAILVIIFIFAFN